MPGDTGLEDNGPGKEEEGRVVFVSEDETEDQLWAQRCKLYLFRAKAKNWVQIGTGKGSLNRTAAGVVSFVFVSEELKIAMARHPLASASNPQPTQGTDKGWSWTARDTIQPPDGDKPQWFTAKFSTAHSGQSFKDAVDMLIADPSTAPPTPGARFPALAQGHLGSISPISSRLASPQLGNAVPRVGEAWLLYFEKGVSRKGSAVRETSTIYIGAFESKTEAVTSSVRAMDMHSDPSWRDRSLWDKVYDRRGTIGDKGVVVAVVAADGSFYHVKLRRVPFNLELPATGLSEGTLWGDGVQPSFSD